MDANVSISRGLHEARRCRRRGRRSESSQTRRFTSQQPLFEIEPMAAALSRLRPSRGPERRATCRV